MRVFLFTFCFLVFSRSLFGQALLSFDYPMIDNMSGFFSDSYDTALLRKNKVESCLEKNLSFYFDINGRLTKSIFIPQDGATQTQLYQYDSRGDLIRTEISSPKYQDPIVSTRHKTYVNGHLMIDSSSSGYFCKHFEYYEDGSLRQELWFAFDHRSSTRHRLRRGFWFGVDSVGRINRVIDRDYMGATDSLGRLLSNRTLFYNGKNQLIKEEEAVRWEENNQKALFCPNAGSATFRYDDAGRLVAISRDNGPSQEIKYLSNGLIAEIETKGKNCVGKPYHWQRTYTYTYRD